MMPPSGWVDATDLHAWSNRIDARYQTPQMLRRLIHATVGHPRRVDFPAGEGVQLSGWDGIVEVKSGNAYVPDGFSVWELGTDRQVKSKADADYKKRTADSLGINPAKATFIFVTSRRWGGKDDWRVEKNAEGVWAEVRAYDAGDLEGWLELAPAVHAWLSRLLGKWPDGAQDLDDYWAEWKDATRPPLSAELTLAGRQNVADKIRQWLLGEAASLSIQADSYEESIAILAAVVHQLPAEERSVYLARSVIVQDATSWRRLAVGQQQLILVPRFDGLQDIQRAIGNGHHVYLPLGKEAVGSETVIQVPRLDRDAAEQALKNMGVPGERARALLEESRQNLPILRRFLATNPEVSQPRWAKPAEAPALIPVLLIGAWDAAYEKDQSVLEALARKPYDDILSTLSRWQNESDPPVRSVGTVWQLVSREDSWRLLSRYITPEDLNLFGTVALTVLGTPEPQYELTPEQRWTAVWNGITSPYSDHLRDGLVETLALLGTRSSAGVPGPESMQERASHIVRKLLTDAPWQCWASLSQRLPLLAEAAPEAFLDMVEQELVGNASRLLRLFDEKGPFYGYSSAHTGLLWALENLAWEPSLLARVALILAKLARLDPGGHLANRSANSLHEIFLLRQPHTMAPLERRLKVLDTLLRREPEVAWQLLCRLIPRPRESASPTHIPRWRDWTIDGGPKVSPKEFWSGVKDIASRILTHVGTAVKRWCDVLSRLSDFPPDACPKAIEALLALDVSKLDRDERLVLWGNVRKVIHRHRQFADAQWALPAEIIERLAVVYQRLEPESAIDRIAWLFSYRPALPEITTKDYKEEEKAIERARNQGVARVFAEGGLHLLLQLASYIEEPYTLGYSAGKSELAIEIIWQLLDATLGHEDTKLAGLGRGFAAGRLSQEGWDWFEHVIATDIFSQWRPAQRVDFLLVPRPTRHLLALVARYGTDTEVLYWRQIKIAVAEEDILEEVIKKMIEHRRPRDAFILAAHAMWQNNANVLPAELVLTVLEQVAAASSTTNQEPSDLDDLEMFQHRLAQVFRVLEKSPDVDRRRLAQLEWTFLPCLRHSEYSPRVLHGELAHNPQFFAEIVSWVFKAEDAEPRDVATLSETERIRAQLGYELLSTWDRLPGLREDGTVDTEHLKHWVRSAREACHAQGRGTTGDHRIGQMLAHAPNAPDGVWPDIAVRDVLEEIESGGIERGIAIGVYNKRGATFREISKGGQEEKTLAAQYRTYADRAADTWPRTAALLQRIAAMYDTEARQVDTWTELRGY